VSVTTDALIEQVQELEAERNALREQVARLEQERDEAEAEQSVLLSTAARFQRERDALRAALEKYGVHGVSPDGGDCPRNITFNASAACTCGFDEALTPAAAPSPAEG
jgi:chromosome segregation ATPase